MKKIMIFLIIFFFFQYLIKCTSTTTYPDSNSYTPLSVGDMTQIIFTQDSSTTLFSIIDKIKRKDGKEVFIGTFKYGTQEPDTSYYAISNGYFISTLLDTVSDDSMMKKINPFLEQRLAKSFPEQGDTWLHTIGNPDSVYWIAEKEELFNTFWGEVDDVFRFELYEKNAVNPFLKTYYGINMGWIGSKLSYFDFPDLDCICSYKKVSGKVYGELWPEKTITWSEIPSEQNRIKKIIRISFINNINILGNTSHKNAAVQID